MNKTVRKLVGIFALFAMLTSIIPSTGAGASTLSSPLLLSGDLIWSKGLGGTNNDIGFGIVVDEDGNNYTVGEFQATVDFDPNAGTTNLTSAGSTDGFISKFDSNGSLIWARQLGSTLADRAMEIALDSANNIYVTGYYRGTVDFDPGTGTTNMTSNGENDMFLLKLDTDGNFLWAKSFGSTE